MIIKLIAKYHTQKQGNTTEEYEDACSYNKDYSRAAIADGATESSYSREWAEILVQHGIEKPISEITHNWQGFTGECKKAFAQKTASLQQHLPWHAQYKVNVEGSFASLALVNFDSQRKTCSALAVGDSCIFLVRKKCLGCAKRNCANQQTFNNKTSFYTELCNSSSFKNPEAFPINTSDQFNNRPFLLGSIKELDSKYIKTYKKVLNRGIYRLYMMTDALAQWFLKRSESKIKPPPWTLLDKTAYNNNFDLFVTKLRNQREIANDDITLLILEIAL